MQITFNIINEDSLTFRNFFFFKLKDSFYHSKSSTLIYNTIFKRLNVQKICIIKKLCLHTKLVDFNKRIVSSRKQVAKNSFLMRLKIYFSINKELTKIINFVELNYRKIILHKLFCVKTKVSTILNI